ncbi:MAG: NADH-quinone oxidoreductase subunit L [Chloroflexi bacterium]|nr:NADH-quinone oxidoreductase subunit L [Chloroflexota bacterium]
MAAILIVCLIGVPWLGAVLVWLAGDRRPVLQHSLAVISSILTAGASLYLVFLNQSQPVLAIPMGSAFGDFTFTPDGLGVFLAAVAAVVGSLAVIYSVDYMRGAAQVGRYYAMVLFFIGAMTGLVLTSNLLLMFFFWEITALTSYSLISFYNDDPKAVAGGLKALIITQLGGLGMLAGALVIYSQLVTYDINVFLANHAQMETLWLKIAAFGFLAAAAAKSSQFPFHTWLPDAMEAPSPISALIHAATMVNAGVYLLARFFPAFEGVPGWRTAVIVVGAVSALIAAVMALFANDLKRVLAYSTVSQLGYMIYAVGAGGIFASQLHLMSHSVFKALLFLAAGTVIHAVGTRDLRQMGGLGRQMPLTQAVFILGALSLAGIPVMNGFWSKELILEAGLEHAALWSYLVMLFAAGLTALYTFRVVWLVFFGEPRSHLHAHDATAFMRVSLVVLAFGTFTTWLLAGPFARLLATTLPFHHFEFETTWEVVFEVITAPATLVALAVVALGLLAWWRRERLLSLQKRLAFLQPAAESAFGFDLLNQIIVALTNALAGGLRVTQTGDLNWNIFAIVTALAVILAILAVGV